MTAIKATFHNFGKPDKRRKMFSFIMEVPIEQTQAVVNFFGSPSTEDGQQFAIAPIVEQPSPYYQTEGENGAA